MITVPLPRELELRLLRSHLTADAARRQFYDVQMHTVAGLVRDALAGADWLLIDVGDQPAASTTVVLRAVGGPTSPRLWLRDTEPTPSLADYRRSDYATWPETVRDVEDALTDAIRRHGPDPRWEASCNGLFCLQLPTAAEFEASRPQCLTARLADEGADVTEGFWQVMSVQRPTMSVAGIAITASVDDDGVLAVDIDPAATARHVMPPTTPVRVRLADTTVSGTAAQPAEVPPPRSPEPGGDQDISTSAQNRCLTERCDETTDDGQGWQDLCGNCADRQLAREGAAPATVVTSLGELSWLAETLDGDGQLRNGHTVDDLQHDNAHRAGFAATGLLAFSRATGLLSVGNDEEPETAIGDLLGDLRHLCDALTLNYDELDGRGERHYSAELRGDF